MKCVRVPVGLVRKTEDHSDNSSGEFGCGDGVDWWKLVGPLPGLGEVRSENNHKPCAVAASHIESYIHTAV